MLISKLRSFSKNVDNKELVLHSLLALIIRIGGAGATFLMNVVITRYLGITQSGYFFLVITITTLLATLGRIGADQTVLRFVSIYSNKRDWEKVHGLMSVVVKWTIFPIVLITMVVCLFSEDISVVIFHKRELHWPLFYGALSMPFFAVTNIFSMGLQGVKKVMLSVTSLKILVPAFLILFAFLIPPVESSNALKYYSIACALALIIAYYWWYKSIPKGTGSFDASIIWKSSLSLWVVSVMQQLVLWSGQFIAGIYNSPEELAQLAAARNTAALITFVLTAVNYVSAPRFASMYAQGKIAELEKYARNSTRLMTLISLPIIVFVWFFPNVIMSLFGKGFIEGIWLLRVLALGQFVNVITGSVGYLLVMSGNEKDLRNITIISGMLAIILALILNPIFGAMGSAISTAIALAGSNLLAVGYVKKRLGFNTLSQLRLK